MDLYITQNSFYFVHRHFIKFFLNKKSEIIYVKEKKRGLIKKYFEIIKNIGFFNTIYCCFCEVYFFVLLYDKYSKLKFQKINDGDLNTVLEEKIRSENIKRIFSIGCPCKINSDLQDQFKINIYNLHGGIIPFQKGRFSPIKGLKVKHKYLGASLYLISDTFDEGSLISQDYFKVVGKNVLVNYNKVLEISSELLDNFLNGNTKKLPKFIFDSLNKTNY